MIARRYSVYSIRVGSDEPFLEGIFASKEEAKEFADQWNTLQPNYEYWVIYK